MVHFGCLVRLFPSVFLCQIANDSLIDKDFLYKFDHIDQTRLFDPSWTVTSSWIKIPVPWAQVYSPTRFEVKIKKKGPVVFVLSQVCGLPPLPYTSELQRLIFMVSLLYLA